MLMKSGGCLLTVTFYRSECVVAHYNLMGPVKATLESAVRYTAAELGPKGIRAHAISAAPIRSRAVSGIDRFDELLDAARRPRRPSTIWSISTTSALPPRSWSATVHATSPGQSSPSMAGSI